MTQPLWVIIPAAGVGQRMQAGFPKQYLPLAGQSILDRTISLFINHPNIAGVAIGLSANDEYWSDSKWLGHEKLATFIGGQERSETVQAGLVFLQAHYNIGNASVLVHDAARPLLSSQALQRILANTHEQGAILAMPSKDTVKLQNQAGFSERTLDRNFIWLAQTPQKFPANDLLMALQKAHAQHCAITDECSAMEFVGWHPELVIGENANIKITLPEDLVIAEALLSHIH